MHQKIVQKNFCLEKCLFKISICPRFSIQASYRSVNCIPKFVSPPPPRIQFFGPKYFRTQNFIGPKIILETKIFLTQNFFWQKKISDQKFLDSQFPIPPPHFFGSELFLARIFFNQNFFDLSYFLDQRFFWIKFFLQALLVLVE